MLTLCRGLQSERLEGHLPRQLGDLEDLETPGF